MSRLRVLFVCVENSCRSQMAEAFARLDGGEGVEAYSAGSRPSGAREPGRDPGDGGGRLRPLDAPLQDAGRPARGRCLGRRRHDGVRRRLPRGPRHAARGLAGAGPQGPGRGRLPDRPRRPTRPRPGAARARSRADLAPEAPEPPPQDVRTPGRRWSALKRRPASGRRETTDSSVPAGVSMPNNTKTKKPWIWRRQYVIDRQLQMGIAGYLAAGLGGVALLCAAALYVFLGGQAVPGLDPLRRFLFVANATYFVLAAGILTLLTILLTHRFAGPAFVMKDAIGRHARRRLRQAPQPAQEGLPQGTRRLARSAAAHVGASRGELAPDAREPARARWPPATSRQAQGLVKDLQDALLVRARVLPEKRDPTDGEPETNAATRIGKPRPSPRRRPSRRSGSG